jgi:hypothetical protein
MGHPSFAGEGWRGVRLSGMTDHGRLCLKTPKSIEFIEFYKKHEAHHISFLTLPLKQMMGAPYLDFEMWDSEDLAP